MPVHRTKNKIANQSTGGNKKGGLVSSIGKSRFVRDKIRNRGLVDVKRNYISQSAPREHFFKYYEINNQITNSPKKITIEQAVSNTIQYFNTDFHNKHFAIFELIDDAGFKHSFIYNSKNSPYSFFSLSVISKEESEPIPISLDKGNFLKFVSHGDKTEEESIKYSLDSSIKPTIPYSDLISLPVSDPLRKRYEDLLFFDVPTLKVWYNNRVDKHGVLCNFLPLEGGGIFEYILDSKFSNPDFGGYKLYIHTHKNISD